MLSLFPIYLLGFVFLLVITDTVHIVEEGYLGMYTRGGALIEGCNLNNLSDILDTHPGYHFMMPFITNFHPVLV